MHEDALTTAAVHPLGSQACVLLTSVFGPYAQDDEYGSRTVNPMELYHNQVTREQGVFSLRMFHRSWGLMLIQHNIDAPCTLLDFPTQDRFIEELKTNDYDVVGIGAGVKLALKRDKDAQDIPSEGFDGGSGVRDPDLKYEDEKDNKHTFKNLRAQYWWYLRDRFEKTYLAIEKNHYIDPDELIALPSTLSDISQLKSELCRVKRKRGVNSLIQLESKKDTDYPSPNMADALVMAFANRPLKKGWGKLNYQKVAIA